MKRSSLPLGGPCTSSVHFWQRLCHPRRWMIRRNIVLKLKDPSLLRERCFVGGEWIDGPAVIDRRAGDRIPPRADQEPVRIPRPPAY
jgi:hypothetical protein